MQLDQIFQDLREALQVSCPHGTNAVIIHKDHKLENLERHLDQPLSPIGSIRFGQIDDLLDYAANHHNENSILLLDPTEGKTLLFIADWHAPRQDVGINGAAWARHRATFKLTLSPEWIAWNSIFSKALPQTTLLEFLEEWDANIQTPAPAALFESLRSLSGKKSITFSSTRRLDNGDVAIEYAEETATTGKTQGSAPFPSELTLRLPVYQGTGDATDFLIRVLIRFRIHEGKIHFELKPIRLDRALTQAALELRTHLTQHLKTNNLPIPILEGAVTKYPTD
jgi:uncharacterized protein YfdQ (DUF2303 family)